MNDTFENFVSNFLQTKNISVFIKNRSDIKFHHFYNHLLSQKDTILITDSFNKYSTSNKIVLNTFDETLIKIVENIKDKNVFISVPVNEWFVSNPNEMHILLKRMFGPLHCICNNNNISLNLTTKSYNTQSGINIMGGTSVMYISSYVVSYENENFKVMKNRCGSVGDILDINTFKPIMSKFYRQKKLERILS